MTIPLMILAVGALIAGFINTPFWEGLGGFLEPVFQEPATPFNPWLAVITTVLALLMLFIAYRVYANRAWRKTFVDPIQPVTGVFFEGFETAWGSDSYVRGVMRPFIALARFLARVVDPRGIDGLVNGTARLVGLGGRGLRLGQTGYLRSYTMVFLVGAIAVLGYFGYAAMR
jgi:NADH-quinone oxidoreductase subunit L